MPRPRGGKNKSNFRRFNNKGKSKGPSQPQGSKEYQHQNQLQEIDVGITKFISDLEGFSGVIKARFSDFQVNEVDPNGEVAKLTNQDVPIEFHNKREAVEAPEETPISQIPQNVWEEIKTILSSSEGKTVALDATELSKEARTEIHETLKKFFIGKIMANTVTENDKRSMIFKKFKGDSRLNWPKDKGEYVHFIVYKECIDTLDTTLKIAHSLKMQASSFAYAGVKDKRAKTTQWFSVRKVDPWKLTRKTKILYNVKIGNIILKDHPLKLGDLIGNKFRIALRNVTGNDELIEKSLENLRDKGFINYYGLQRFGNDKEVPTFSIGNQLLLGNWKEACEIILKRTDSDRPEYDITKAKKVYAETGDAAKALEEFEDNKKTCIEYLLLAGLSKGHAHDYVNALSSIPRNTRLLYIHSFQSLIWNLVASKRIEKYGLDVVEGDLVFLEKEQKENNIEDKKEDDVEKNGESSEEKKRPQVKALTAEECSNYTIYDIILPLPGFDVVYPKNLEDFYKETLERYGLTLEMAQQKVKDYSVSGTYRKLLRKVKNLSWKIMHYNDPNYNLIRSDLEEMKGMEEPHDIPGGAYKALVLEFSLTSSSYATMVIREILKTDTSSSAHAKLNNYHAEPKETKKIQEAIAPNGNEEVVSENIGLLADAKKFEAFKNLIFGEEEDVEEPALKRKHENGNDPQSAKVAKMEENGS